MFDIFKQKSSIKDKLLDTSVLVDGRICDIVSCGFLEGKLVVPKFILEELQKLSDSGDEAKRKKGKRGLEFLVALKNCTHIDVAEEPKECLQEIGADAKLIKFCKINGCKLVTLDYNLNQIAVLQDIAVININALIMALRQKIMIGEKLWVTIIKPGTEKGQGTANLDDGTMVVVDGGFNYIGQKIKVKMRQEVQTISGRMIFCTVHKEGE
jgi:uncharacterized protein YacL